MCSVLCVVCVCIVYVCVHMHAWVEVRGRWQLSSSVSPTSYCLTQAGQWTELTDSSGLAEPWTPGPSCNLLLSVGVTGTCLTFYMGPGYLSSGLYAFMESPQAPLKLLTKDFSVTLLLERTQYFVKVSGRISCLLCASRRINYFWLTSHEE